MKKMVRPILSLVLVSCLFMASFSLSPVLAEDSSAGISDIDGHWAEDVIDKWTDAGLAKGYEDGSFRPNNPVTRAEFMTMANRAFAYSKEGEASFTDVSSEDWFYGAVVSAADYISGYPDNTMRPNNPISRQEVAKVLASIAHLRVGDGAFDETSFKDSSSFPAWSRGAIGASSAKAFVKGYPDGSFRPLASITRAEALKALDNTMIKVSLISKAGTIEDATYQGDLVIAHDQVTLNDVIVEGDLIIGEEVGEGDVYLNDVTVRGDTFVRGGGLNSVYINGGDYKKVVVEKSGSGVRLVCTNNDGVEVSLDLPDSEVVLEGDFEKVEVKTEGIKLSFQGDTTVGELRIDERATNTQVRTEEKVVLKKAVVESKTDFIGQGTIDEAEGDEAEDSSFEKEPDVVNDVVTTSPEESSGGGGSGSGGSTTVKVDSISVSPGTLVLAVYDSASIKASVTPSNAANKKVTWKSSNEDIVTVDSDGKVIAVAVGEATITATTEDGGKIAITQVEVKTPSPESAFQVDSETGTIIEVYNGSEADIVIPAKIEGVEVKVIGTGAFGDRSLSSVLIPNSVTTIGDSAFASNELTEVTIPNSVTTIGEEAFYDNLLTEVAIPNSVTSIGGYAFEFNELEEVTIPNSLTSIGEGVFAENKLTEVTIPNSVTRIAEEAFYDNLLTEVAIPNSVTSIGDYAFESNELDEVTIPNSVTNIGDYTFMSNALTKAVIPNKLTTIGEGVFTDNNLEYITIPNSVTTIGEGAFSSNQLISITIPNSVETIGEAAFYGNLLPSVTIPDSVTTIGARAFNFNLLPDDQAFIYGRKEDGSEDKTKIVSYGGAKREGVQIPDSVKEIGNLAFAYNELTEVTIPNSVISLADNAFLENGRDTHYNGNSIPTGDFVGTWVTDNENKWNKKVAATNTIADATPKNIDVALDVAVTGLVKDDFAVTKAGPAYINFTVTETDTQKYVITMDDAAASGDVFTVTITKAGYAFIGTAVENNVAAVQSSEKAITAFSFEGLAPSITGSIDESAKTIALTVPNATDVTALVATFTNSANSAVAVGGTAQVSGTTENDFTSPVIYKVTAEDETTVDYTVKVTKAAKLASTLSFAETGPIAKVVGDAAFTNTATGDGDGAITYESGTPAIATVSETTGEVTILTAGSTVITAVQAASATHGAGTATYTISVTTSSGVYGSGTEQDPWKIEKIEDLLLIGSTDTTKGDWGLSDHYIILSDLDFDSDSDYSNPLATGTDWNGDGSSAETIKTQFTTGLGWLPITDYDTTQFSGHFDGNGKTISNLFIDRPTDDYQALFGATDGAVISDLGLLGVNITGWSEVAALVADATDTNISFCYSTGSIAGEDMYLGGLVGWFGGSSIDPTIKYSYSTVNVTGTGEDANYVGGLAGSLYNGAQIHASYAAGDIIGHESVGGLVGDANQGYDGYDKTGNAAIKNAYATGNVSGNNNIGGIVGNISWDILVYRSYAMGSVSGIEYVGGIAGYYDQISGDNCRIVQQMAFNPAIVGNSNTHRVLGGSNGAITAQKAQLEGNVANENMTVNGSAITTAGSQYAEYELDGEDIADMESTTVRPLNAWNFGVEGVSDGAYWEIVNMSGTSRPVLFVYKDGQYVQLGQ